MKDLVAFYSKQFKFFILSNLTQKFDSILPFRTNITKIKLLGGAENHPFDRKAKLAQNSACMDTGDGMEWDGMGWDGMG